MVDLPPLHQPQKIHAIPAGILQLPAGADAQGQPVKNGPGYNPRMDGRLPGQQEVPGFPGGPVHLPQDLIHQPYGMVLADGGIQGGRE